MALDYNFPGWIFEEEMRWLEHICRLAPTGYDQLEIGPFAGRSTQVLAEVNTSTNIYCIDPWPAYTKDEDLPHGGRSTLLGRKFRPQDIFKIFQKDIQQRYKNVQAIQGTFPENKGNLKNLGLIFVEIDPTLELFEAAWDLLIPGGIFTGRLFCMQFPDIVETTRALSNIKKSWIHQPPGTSLFYLQKEYK
jgi:hypothetical protein